MENTCNYSDNWQPYIGDYDKFEYDVKLFNGDIIENCYPNAGQFNPQFGGDSVQEKWVSEIRFSNTPKIGLDNPYSEFKPDWDKLNKEYEEFKASQRRRSEIFELTGMPTAGLQYLNFVPDLSMSSNREWRNTYPSQIRTEPKIGRNQICPCGSGLKAKKCNCKSKN